MSACTSLQFYRPQPAPVISPRDLGEFLGQLVTTGALKGSGRIAFELKFGTAIDQDDLESTITIANGIISTYESIAWDWSGQVKSLDELSQILLGDDRALYRGELSLGLATETAYKQMARTNSPENEIDFTPDSWSLSLGPVFLENSDIRFQAGWMSVAFHGYGYLYPWTSHDLLMRIEQSPELCAVMDLCRRQWPVPPALPTPAECRLRKKLGALWPYHDLDKPWDWYWGIYESL